MVQVNRLRLRLWLVCAASLAAVAARPHDGDAYYASRKRSAAAAELLRDTYSADHRSLIPGRDVRVVSKFWSGSRYGRSGGRGGGGSSSHPARLEVEPRGDRFFMGSRYGKRAGRFPARTTRMSYELARLAPAHAVDPAVQRPLRPRR